MKGRCGSNGPIARRAGATSPSRSRSASSSSRARSATGSTRATSPSRSARRRRRLAARSRAAARAEAGVGRAARGRRRARLQQHADGDPRLRRADRRRLPRRRSAAGVAGRDQEGGVPLARHHAPAPGVLAQADDRAARRGSERAGRRSEERALAPHRRAHRAGFRPRRRAVEGGVRSGAGRADAGEPDRQRARRAAGGGPHHGRDVEHPPGRGRLPRSGRRPAGRLRRALGERRRRRHGPADARPTSSSPSSRRRRWARAPGWGWPRCTA